MVIGSPKKNLIKGIKKIEKGKGSPKLVDSLKKIITKHPEFIDDAAYQLIGIIQTDKTGAFGYSIDMLLGIAEIESDLLANSAEAIIKIIQTSDDNLDINDTLKAMDILSIIAIGHPDLMQSAVPVLLKKLNHTNSRIRQASYYILDFIAKPCPEFFSNYTLDLIRGLNGLNIDERIYAVKLIDEIAHVSPDIIEESYDTLYDLAYKHPSLQVRQEVYDVFKKYKIEEEIIAPPDEKLYEFEKDFIGPEEISEQGDFERLADELAQRIAGIDFESSAAELLKSYDMGHLIVKPEYVEQKINKIEIIEPPVTNEVHKKLPPKPDEDEKSDPDLKLNRIEHLITDPIIRARLSSLKDIAQKNDVEKQETQAETIEEHEEVDDKSELLPDITIEMIHTILTELSKEEWIVNLGLSTRDGKLIDAIDPDSIDTITIKKISDMLGFENTSTRKEKFRNRVSIEYSDKFVVAMSIDSDYIFIIFTKTDAQFGIVLYELNRTADKIEEILK